MIHLQLGFNLYVLSVYLCCWLNLNKLLLKNKLSNFFSYMQSVRLPKRLLSNRFVWPCPVYSNSINIALIISVLYIIYLFTFNERSWGYKVISNYVSSILFKVLINVPRWHDIIGSYISWMYSTMRIASCLT